MKDLKGFSTLGKGVVMVNGMDKFLTKSRFGH